MGKVYKPLALTNKHLTKQEIAEKELAESMVKGKCNSIKAPAWLKDKIAKKEFKRLVDELMEIDIICNLDVNNLASYCESYSKYVQATKELFGQTLTIQKCMPNGAYTYVENPLIKIQKTYADECRRFASLIGLTIDSRLKFASAKVKEINNEIQDEFGEI